jgi:bacterioferritin
MAVSHATDSKSLILATLGDIFQMETAGIIRYLHYSFMIMGYNRIPLVSAPIQDTKTHSIDEILHESLAFETATLSKYKDLLKLAGDDIALEELARSFIRTETEHIEEVQKMVRKDR